MKFTETEIKYLAGLLDADGSFHFHFTPYKDYYNVSLKLVLQQSLSIDKDGKFMTFLAEKGGSLQLIELEGQNPNWANANRWTVTGVNQLNMLIPRLTKHMVVKAKHWQDMLDKLNSLDNKNVSAEGMTELKEFALQSRKNVGPLAPKKHPTWAWVAGFLDGDGCYYMRTRKKGNSIWKELIVTATAATDDNTSLELLHKAFGGRLETRETTKTWVHSLGIRDRSFAINFLRKMQRHSRLKRYKIERMLQYHQQRLTESNPTG